MKIRAILFDLHHTLTKFTENPLDVVRRISNDCGVRLAQYTDDEMEAAYLAAGEWLQRYQIENDVDPHHGEQPEHWIESNRIMYGALGETGIGDDILLEVEYRFKQHLVDMEVFTDEAVEAVKTLHARGYPIGVVTRRYDDPRRLIAKFDLSRYFSTVHWSGVKGYAKPSPFGLLKAADDIGINPLRCAYVGNLVDADVTASMRAQMLPVLLTWANPEEADKAPEEAVIMNSPLELLDFFHGPNNLIEIA